MELTSTNSLKAEGVFLNGKKVRGNHIEYLKALEHLSAIHDDVNSYMILKHLKKSKGTFDTLTVMEKLGYIKSDEKRPFYPKKWRATETGEAILHFIRTN
jgi:hypothetical protein